MKTKAKAKTKKPRISWKAGTILPVYYWVQNSHGRTEFNAAWAPTLSFYAPDSGRS
jgi:hypothetical protein